MAVGTASDYAALLKEYQAKQAGVKKWEDIFLQPYQTAAEQVSTQTQYDISGAFAQYKKSQLSAMQNIQLGTGFKEQIASDLASQYGSAYSQLRQEESSKLGKLQTSYLQTLAQQEEALAEQGERFAEIESALYDYMGITDKSLLEQAYGVDGGLGFFEMTEPGSYKITERGIDAFDKALNDYYNATEKDRGQLFTEYLAEQDVELLDWYKQNSDIVKQLVGGLESGDVSYNKEERLYRIMLNDLYTDDNRDVINNAISHFNKNGTDKEKLEIAEYTIEFENTKNKIQKDISDIRKLIPENSNKRLGQWKAAISQLGFNVGDMDEQTYKALYDDAHWLYNNINKTINDFNTAEEYNKFIKKLNSTYKAIKPWISKKGSSTSYSMLI